MIYVQEIIQETFGGQLFSFLDPRCVILSRTHPPLTNSLHCLEYTLIPLRAATALTNFCKGVGRLQDTPSPVSGPYLRALPLAPQPHWRKRQTAQPLCPRTSLLSLPMQAEATFAKVNSELLHDHRSLLSIFPIDSTIPALCRSYPMCYAMRMGRIIGSCG
jgi:hypothetical protein